MQRPYQLIAFRMIGDVYSVRVKKLRLEDSQMEDLGAELGRLIDEENCQKMVINLGPEDPECLISIFLAKLINLQRRLVALNGRLILAHASDSARNILRIAGIEKHFLFCPDEQTAVEALNGPA